MRATRFVRLVNRRGLFFAFQMRRPAPVAMTNIDSGTRADRGAPGL